MFAETSVWIGKSFERGMADHGDSVMEKITEKFHEEDSSSSSDSDDGKKTSSFKSDKFRLFGREKPLHKVLGGSKRTFITTVIIKVNFFNCFFFFWAPSVFVYRFENQFGVNLVRKIKWVLGHHIVPSL